MPKIVHILIKRITETKKEMHAANNQNKMAVTPTQRRKFRYQQWKIIFKKLGSPIWQREWSQDVAQMMSCSQTLKTQLLKHVLIKNTRKDKHAAKNQTQCRKFRCQTNR